MFRIKSGIPYVDSYVNFSIYYALRKRWRHTCLYQGRGNRDSLFLTNGQTCLLFRFADSPKKCIVILHEN